MSADELTRGVAAWRIGVERTLTWPENRLTNRVRSTAGRRPARSRVGRTLLEREFGLGWGVGGVDAVEEAADTTRPRGCARWPRRTARPRCGPGARASRPARGTVSVVTTSVIIGCSRSRSTALPTNSPWVQATARRCSPVREPVEQLDDRAAGGDLVVEHDRPLAVRRHRRSRRSRPGRRRAAACCRPRPEAEQPGELGGGLGVAEVGRDHDGVGEVLGQEVVGEDAERRSWSTGTEKKPCTCGACRVIVMTRSTPAVASRSATRRPPMRDAGGVLLVRAGVGVVRDDRGDRGRAGAPRRVDHQEQLHQVLLRRRHQRLHDVDVALAAVRLELGLEAVVAETGSPPARADAEVGADPLRQTSVGTSAEHDDLSHGSPRTLRPRHLAPYLGARLIETSVLN